MPYPQERYAKLILALGSTLDRYKELKSIAEAIAQHYDTGGARLIANKADTPAEDLRTTLKSMISAFAALNSHIAEHSPPIEAFETFAAENAYFRAVGKRNEKARLRMRIHRARQNADYEAGIMYTPPPTRTFTPEDLDEDSGESEDSTIIEGERIKAAEELPDDIKRMMEANVKKHWGSNQ